MVCSGLPESLILRLAAISSGLSVMRRLKSAQLSGKSTGFTHLLMSRRSPNSQDQKKNPADQRAEAVLAAIIKEHLVTGEAVGSRVLSDRFANGVGWSSATIRNVMAELEQAGLVEQPHTSAGRVPTDNGYRYYVDHMLSETSLSAEDLRSINEMLNSDSPESAEGAEGLMGRASHALSALSENVGIVISPTLAGNCLKHIEFVLLADRRILVVMVSAANLVHNKLIYVDAALGQDELDRTARYLNVEFAGKSLLAIRARILELMREEKAMYDKLLRNAIMLCNRSLEGPDAENPNVYVDGTSNILMKPDFPNIEKMRELFRTFEEKSRLVKILSECISRDSVYPGNVHIVIGRENATPSMQNCALISAPYRIQNGEGAGTIGVVGPMRIEYSRVSAMVNYMARLIERRLTEAAL